MKFLIVRIDLFYVQDANTSSSGQTVNVNVDKESVSDSEFWQ